MEVVANDPWAALLERLDDAAKLTGVDPDIHRLLRTPRRILEVAVPVRMDDGSVDVFTAWLMDTIEKVHGIEVGGSVTGKPLALGGTPAHAGATASGVVTCVRAAFAALDVPFVGSRAVLQGFGKVGGTLAFLLSSAGMRI